MHLAIFVWHKLTQVLNQVPKYLGMPKFHSLGLGGAIQLNSAVQVDLQAAGDEPSRPMAAVRSCFDHEVGAICWRDLWPSHHPAPPEGSTGSSTARGHEQPCSSFKL